MYPSIYFCFRHANQHKETFTFGANTFKNSVPQVQDHQTTFRLVGCSIKISHQPMWTPLEQQRMRDWTKVVQRIQNLPRSWQIKVRVLQSVMSKLTFGQGMKTLQVSKDVMRSMRATVVRALLYAYNYNSAPNATFASFLSVGGKLVARICAARLQRWANPWLSKMQFGFRSGSGVADVHQVTRRLLEEAAQSVHPHTQSFSKFPTWRKRIQKSPVTHYGEFYQKRDVPPSS